MAMVVSNVLLCFSYESMRTLCDRYNRAIDSIRQLVSIGLSSVRQSQARSLSLDKVKPVVYIMDTVRASWRPVLGGVSPNIGYPPVLPMQ